jgi:AraC-like DNA-binding protein
VVSGINIFVISVPFDPIIFTYIGLTLFSFAFSVYGYRQASIYNRYPDGFPSVLGTPDEEHIKYAKSGLSDSSLKIVVQDLEKLMNSEMLYLQAELSLADISKKLKIPRHHLTQALNTQVGKNFYTYINEFRVETVIESLKKPENRQFTVLAIALESGFNSKSTFNSVFKKITGLTPSEFIRQLPGTD